MNRTPETDGVDGLQCSPSSAAPPRNPSESIHLRQRRHQDQPPQDRHVTLRPPVSEPQSPATSIYHGSYGHGPSRFRASLRPSSQSAPVTPRMSISSAHLADILHDSDSELPLYGLEELRNGFFDGSFHKPRMTDDEELEIAAKLTLPVVMRGRNPLSIKKFFPHLFSELRAVLGRIVKTRAGIKLTKSFLAFFVAYILCLIPSINRWLGRYSYFMAISAIINHPGRTVGAQIDGSLSTIFGTATGLAWGAFALYLSSSSPAARNGYGGVLASFLIVFMGSIAYIRANSIRLYQFVLCAGISISYTCLAETSTTVHWDKFLDYSIPWLLGQGIALLVCCTVFPDAGARPLAVCLHSSFKVMLDGLVIPQQDTLRLHRQLANTFVSLSVAYRDLVIDISITRFHPRDVEELRNLMQGVIRSLLSMKPQTNLFQIPKDTSNLGSQSSPAASSPPQVQSSAPSSDARDCFALSRNDSDAVIDIDPTNVPPPPRQSLRPATELVATKLAEPTRLLLQLYTVALTRCDATLLTMSVRLCLTCQPTFLKCISPEIQLRMSTSI